MILLLAVVLGFLIGFSWAHLHGRSYTPPALGNFWLAFVAFLLQYLLLNLPVFAEIFSDLWIGILLTVSQILLLGFAWLNRKLPGMPLLLIGAALNFTVMAANGGFMPISPQTASRLVSENVLMDIPIGSRFGHKDILLEPENTHFEWFSDRFLPPESFGYQVAFSLGDIFLAIGVFWLLAHQKKSDLIIPQRIST